MEFISLYDVRMTYQKMPKFFEHIDIGEEIFYCVEELRFISKAIPTELKDKEFLKEHAEPLWFGLAAEGLRRVTQSYITSEDFASAQESCIKLLEFPTSTEDDWLLLADILAEQNDREKAKLILEEAEKEHQKSIELGIADSHWIDKTRQIRSKLSEGSQRGAKPL